MSRLFFPSTQQNIRAIWGVLSRLLPGPQNPGKILEVASGSGEHLQFFRSQAPGLLWQGSDPNPEHRASIDAWNPDPPAALDLDVTWPEWPIEADLDGVIAINLLHISPWQATPALFQGCQKVLKPGGWLYLYGAYFTDLHPTAPSNLAFDQSLRAQNPEWGVRRLEDVTHEAQLRGLHRAEVVSMPSHNYSLIFRKL